MPGDICCRTIAVSDMVCICGSLTKEDMREVNSMRLIYTAKECGRPLPVGTKCGSKCFILLFFLEKSIYYWSR
ncbi:hypothetical protein HU200_058558 [Digitaria exilis]|uniref:Bifunctional inhibitor/plant lipid transfer protein/seed storage helical domain-containing protein n=1 Tax=Digitaria exilis TaxID=1010633 RepID=A0A835A9H8_9POAL|nr:hypothetical protein HU200_058558 [Digitaria exilis]